MLTSASRHALEHYHSIDAGSGVESASPQRLIQMLLEGAIARVAGAGAALRRGAVASKGEQISAAISIIDGLRASLDFDRGGEVAANLEQVYEYMSRRLVEANLHNDERRLQEVHALLRQIKQAWDAISVAADREPSALAAGMALHAGG